MSDLYTPTWEEIRLLNEQLAAANARAEIIRNRAEGLDQRLGKLLQENDELRRARSMAEQDLSTARRELEEERGRLDTLEQLLLGDFVALCDTETPGKPVFFLQHEETGDCGADVVYRGDGALRPAIDEAIKDRRAEAGKEKT